jgi:hypothetical protein
VSGKGLFSVLLYKGVSKSFQTGRLERELQTVQLSATRCSCITILWVSLVSFATIILCLASQWVVIVVSVHFVIDFTWKLLDISSYCGQGYDTKDLSVSLHKTKRFWVQRPKIRPYNLVQFLVQSKYSLVPKYLSQQTIAEIIYDSYSEECTWIPDTEVFQNTFVLVVSVAPAIVFGTKQRA